MPELPEIETIVRTLRPALVGRAIVAAQLARQDIVRPRVGDLPQRLAGRSVSSVERRGKYIVIAMDDGNRWCIHLGMSGRLTLESPDAPVQPHTHLILTLSADQESQISNPKSQISNLESHISNLKSELPNPQSAIRNPQLAELRLRDPRRFGHIKWLGQDRPVHDAIGPEPLGIASRDFAPRLARTKRAIKSALLDQRLLAGLGNIYVDEALFAAGIYPLRRACDLSPDESRRLLRAIKTVLRRAIRHRGSTLRDYVDANGSAGGFQRMHRVYGREGEPCAGCGAAIQRIVLGGRSTHFCPACQKP